MLMTFRADADDVGLMLMTFRADAHELPWLAKPEQVPQCIG
jgi:hypothetical protein